MKRILFLSGLSLITLALPRVAAQVAIQETEVRKGAVHLLARNEYFELEFVPEKGGCAISFKTRYSGSEWACPEGGGLFQDSPVVSGVNEAGGIGPYTGRIVANKPEAATVEFQGKVNDDVLLTRTVSLTAGSPIVAVKCRMVNRGMASVSVGLQCRSAVYAGGSKENTRQYRPEQGASWAGVLNAQTQEGLVWLVADRGGKPVSGGPAPGAVVWSYEPAPLAKGAAWETEYSMVLVKGFTVLSYASADIIAGTTMEKKKKLEFFGPGTEENPEFLLIGHTLSRSISGDIKKAKLIAALRGADGREEFPLETLDAGALSWEPKQFTHSAKVDMNQRLRCEVTVTGKDSRGKLDAKYAAEWDGGASK